jgi:DNA-binding NtrC family response regulator
VIDLQDLIPGWVELQRDLSRQIRVLIVDDEPQILVLFRQLLAEDGFAVHSAESAEEAWARVESIRYDLLVVDKNLPGDSGLQLISRVTSAGIDVPSVLITAFPSPESIAEALDSGAADYLDKPFGDIQHLRSRLLSLVDHQLSKLLFDQIIRDLVESVRSDLLDTALLADLQGRLYAFKQSLRERPDVLVLGDSQGALAADLAAAGLTLAVLPSPSAAPAAVDASSGPMVAVVDLSMADAEAVIRRLKQSDPLVEILVAAGEGSTRAAVAALDAGATDIVLRASEAPVILSRRAQRLVVRSRRHRLSMHLLTALHELSPRSNPKAPYSPLASAPDTDRHLIHDGQRTTSPMPALPAGFELDSYADDPLDRSNKDS